VEEASAGQVDNLQCLKRVGSVNSPFLGAAVQLEFLINGWCAAHSRPDLLRAHRRLWPNSGLMAFSPGRLKVGLNGLSG
jgi:hypothetical protein